MPNKIKKKNKKIRITAIDTELIYDNDYYETKIHESDYPNLAYDRKITNNEFDNAISIIIGYYMQTGISEIVVDLDERSFDLLEPQEISIDEIEKELGYKVKIYGKNIRIKDEHGKTYLINDKGEKIMDDLLIRCQFCGNIMKPGEPKLETKIKGDIIYCFYKCTKCNKILNEEGE